MCVSLGDTTEAIGKSGPFPFPQEDRPALEEPGWIERVNGTHQPGNS